MNSKTLGVIVLGFASPVVMFLFLLLYPVHLNVRITSYNFDRNNLGSSAEVYFTSSVGVKTPVFNGAVYELTDNELIAYAGHMKAKAKVVPKSLHVSYMGQAYEGNAISADDVLIVAVFEDGTEMMLDDFEVKDVDQVLGKENVTYSVKTRFGPLEFSVTPATIKEVKSVYTGEIKSGSKLDKELFDVSVIYENGDSITIDDFTYDDPGVIKGKTKVKVHTNYGDTVMTVTPESAQTAKIMPDDMIAVEGEKPDIKYFAVSYADGTQESVSINDADFVNLPDKWAAGLNNVSFTYQDSEYAISVYAVPHSVSEASDRDTNIGDGKVYSLKEKELKALSKAASVGAEHNADVMAARVSVLLNRYDETDGKDFMEFIKDDALFKDYEDGSEDPNAVVIAKYIATTGHRTVPVFCKFFADSQDDNLTSCESPMEAKDKTSFVYYGHAAGFCYGYKSGDEPEGIVAPKQSDDDKEDNDNGHSDEIVIQ